MRDKQMIIELLDNIENSLSLIVEQTQNYASADDFLRTPAGVLLLDGVYMNLLAIGEAVKNLDKRTGGELLPKYPAVPWKDIMRTRDVIAHHYFDVDAERVFLILRNDVPPLLDTIQQIKADLQKEK
ncbi:MAG: DUF86 domain-containing protein [Candidatus Margulisbacteria bacterium]|jgi:uncharacterized protein with HEPN domain|nr:DUF86 domain-containing protein [Candidatus Margulisiibacteriota bacterium]